MYDDNIEFAINWEESTKEYKKVTNSDSYRDRVWNTMDVVNVWSGREQISWNNFRSQDFLFIDDTE